jgi:hypothetical protein
MGDRRAQIERGWILISIAYGGLRAVLVWKFLSRYGVNAYVFGPIEFFSAVLFGKSSATVVGAVVDGAWHRLRIWLPVAVLSYFAPDTYVFLSVGRLPSNMLFILISVASVTLVLTCVGMFAQVRRSAAVAPA